MAAEDWEFLKDSTTVNLEGIFSCATSGDTVAVTNSSVNVIGTGTTFTSHAVGDFMRFGSESQPYIIGTISNATGLSLEASYGGATDTSTTYEIARRIYTPSVNNVGEIKSIVYQKALEEVSENWLNAIDPERNSTGSPSKYRIFSKSKADGLVTFEIWPIPDQDYVVTIFYKKYVSDLTADTDEPVFRPELIEAGALWDCYRHAFAITQNPAWIGMARDAKVDYASLLRETIIEDMGTASLTGRVRDVMIVHDWDDNFRTSHDTEPY